MGLGNGMATIVAGLGSGWHGMGRLLAGRECDMSLDMKFIKAPVIGCYMKNNLDKIRNINSNISSALGGRETVNRTRNLQFAQPQQ